MKKSDWILAGAVLLAACLSAGFFYGSRDRGNFVSIQVDGVEYGRYDLLTEQVVEIGETNRLEIRDGKASMVHADCPDQLCVQMAPVSEVHELIVCMPNRVVVEVMEE
ncbi:MAG: NusG domain II-containing protein [Lachnospiraceae bacterium]|nr:NusG domain II-containing protein [Lachnospiraceae bacterium]